MEEAASMPLRISKRMKEEVKKAGEVLFLKDQEAFRLCCEIGLAALAHIDYDVAGAVARLALPSGGHAEKAMAMTEAQREAFVRRVVKVGGKSPRA